LLLLVFMMKYSFNSTSKLSRIMVSEENRLQPIVWCLLLLYRNS
jgi:hypothetical protein